MRLVLPLTFTICSVNNTRLSSQRVSSFELKRLKTSPEKNTNATDRLWVSIQWMKSDYTICSPLTGFGKERVTFFSWSLIIVVNVWCKKLKLTSKYQTYAILHLSLPNIASKSKLLCIDFLVDRLFDPRALQVRGTEQFGCKHADSCSLWFLSLNLHSVSIFSTHHPNHCRVWRGVSLVWGNTNPKIHQPPCTTPLDSWDSFYP